MASYYVEKEEIEQEMYFNDGYEEPWHEESSESDFGDEPDEVEPEPEPPDPVPHQIELHEVMDFMESIIITSQFLSYFLPYTQIQNQIIFE